MNITLKSLAISTQKEIFMSKLNYQKQLEQTLLSIEKQSIKAKLLLHSCCAPCSSYVLEYLSQYFEITVLYYNPNISPEEEYFIRGQEQNGLSPW